MPILTIRTSGPPTYSDSFGNRWTTAQIEHKIRHAAFLKLNEQLDEHGYNFCEECKRNDDKPIDISHTVSRKRAKEEGRVEVLWDLENLEILGRKCHKKKDALQTQWKNQKSS